MPSSFTPGLAGDLSLQRVELPLRGIELGLQIAHLRRIGPYVTAVGVILLLELNFGLLDRRDQRRQRRPLRLRDRASPPRCGPSGGWSRALASAA